MQSGHTRSAKSVFFMPIFTEGGITWGRKAPPYIINKGFTGKDPC